MANGEKVSSIDCDEWREPGKRPDGTSTKFKKAVKDFARKGYDGLIEENMTLCVESFIGDEHGGEGVKLEQLVLITKNGPEPLTTFPFEDKLL